MIQAKEFIFINGIITATSLLRNETGIIISVLETEK